MKKLIVLLSIAVLFSACGTKDEKPAESKKKGIVEVAKDKAAKAVASAKEKADKTIADAKADKAAKDIKAKADKAIDDAKKDKDDAEAKADKAITDAKKDKDDALKKIGNQYLLLERGYQEQIQIQILEGRCPQRPNHGKPDIPISIICGTIGRRGRRPSSDIIAIQVK